MLTRLPPSVLLGLSALFWGGNFVVGRWAHDDIAPLSLTFVRWTVSALILAPFVVPGIWRHRQLIREHLGLLSALAITGMVMFHSFTYIALNTTEAINAAFVLAAMPMVIPVVSILMGNERLSSRQAMGIGISVIGVGIIISRGDLNVLLNLTFTPGDLWVLGAVVAWSVYSVLLRRKPAELPPMVLLGVTNGLAVIYLLPFYLWELSEKGGFAVTTSNVLVIAYVAIFASIVAFICWNAGVAKLGANKSGLFIHLIPLFASMLSMLFLGESLKSYHLVGIIPVLLGIYLTATAHSKPKVI